MKYFEFGQGNPELMVMLPGGGVCYRGAIPIAEEMAKVYHVVLVAYDGFNPDEPGTETNPHRTRQSGQRPCLHKRKAGRRQIDEGQ